MTSVCAPSAVSECLINFYNHGKELYETFRNERFVEKSRKLSDTIKKVNLPKFVPKPKEKTERKQIKSDTLVKELSYVQKNVDIARVRGITLSHIMEHDLMSTNTLFCEGTTRKPDKSVLVHELEKHFDKSDLTFTKTSKLETTLLIDFMSMVRRMPISEMSVFLDLFQATWKKVKAICDFQRVDVVFDSYVEKSIKEGERKRRSCVQPLEYVNLENDTRIPVQSDRFWASSNNKEMVQCLSRSYLSQVAVKEGVKMVLSGYVSSNNDTVSCIKTKEDGDCVQLSDLNSSLEEADLRLIPHIHHALLQGAQHVVVPSNDTDVFALILYYTPEFVNLGAKEIWIMFGTGDKSRFLPMHTLLQKIGTSLCKAVFKVHVLSGSDTTSKIGTKRAALNSNPGRYLCQFGEDDDLTMDALKNTEQYLVKILQPQSCCTSFDQLRFEMYFARKISYLNLPPSSHSLRGHIQRCHFVVRQGISLLDGITELDPCDFGWAEVDGYILPEKQLLPLPAYFLVRCGYKKKCTG